MPVQASRSSFVLLCSTSFFRVFTPTEANFLALKAPESRLLKANFQKFSGDNTPGRPCGRAAPFRTHPSATFCFARDSSTPVLGSRPPYPLRNYGAPHLCPSKNKLLVPPLTLLLVHLILYASPHHSPYLFIYLLKFINQTKTYTQ